LVSRRSGNVDGYVTVSVPAGWVFADESIPSDHNDWIYYDPANPAARFEFSGSGCGGCIHPGGDDTKPATPVLPGDVTRTVRLDGGAAIAFTEPPADGYAVNGVARLQGKPSNPDGYAITRVALPPADAAEATRILDSVTLGAQQ
jgi:hypothetical protein